MRERLSSGGESSAIVRHWEGVERAGSNPASVLEKENNPWNLCISSWDIRNNIIDYDCMDILISY